VHAKENTLIYVDTKPQHQYLLFELTKKCQNNCIFCYNVWKEDKNYPEKELSTEDTISLLKKVIPESGCKYIGLSGGEPLLKKDIFKIASYISSQGVLQTLISNGKLLTKETVAKAVDSGIKNFEISLHSHDSSIHDDLVGREGSFEEAIEAILNIKGVKKQVYTVFVATKRNIHTFKEFVELNALMGINWILFNRVACGGSCLTQWNSLVPSPSDIQQALDRGVPIAEKYKIGISAGVQIQPCFVNLSKYKNMLHSFCPLNDIRKGNTYYTIDPAGNLRMCNRSKIILGNLLEEPFSKISENQEVENFRKSVPEFCLVCKLARMCAGGCKADAFSYYGTPCRPDPFLELWKDKAKIPNISVF
jgi:radical SAM protein with 4Fe4S-binding SPASM domain